LWQLLDATLEQDVTSPEAAGAGVTEQVDNSAALLRKLGPIVVPDNETDGLAHDSSEQSSVSAWLLQLQPQVIRHTEQRFGHIYSFIAFIFFRLFCPPIYFQLLPFSEPHRLQHSSTSPLQIPLLLYLSSSSTFSFPVYYFYPPVLPSPLLSSFILLFPCLRSSLSLSSPFSSLLSLYAPFYIYFCSN
jgi:hypothetical protein